MKELSKTRFIVGGYKFLKSEETNPIFIKLKEQIKEHGHFMIKSRDGLEAKIYNTHLAYFLMFWRDKPATIQGTKEKAIVSGFDFWDAYFIGYQKGIDYFNENYKASTDVMYGKHAKQYVQDLHDQYYHTQIEMWYGWGYYARNICFDMLISEEKMAHHGYYAALVDCVDQLKDKYPNIFQNFDNCKLHGQIQSAEPPNDHSSKEFPDYLQHPKREELAEALKNEFNDGKGKVIAMLIQALKDLELVNIVTRKLKPFFEDMENYFDRDIGSYNAMNKYKEDTIKSQAHHDEYESTKKRVEKVLGQIKDK